MLKKITLLPLWAKFVVLIIVIATVYVGYKKLKDSAETTPSFQTTQAQKGNLIVTVTASGSVSSANSASVTTSVSGVVKKIYAPNGTSVKSGQKLAEVELDQDSKQKYAQASSSYQSAKNQLASAQSTLYTLQSKMFAANQKFINDAVARDLVESDPTHIQQNADWLASEADYKNQQNVIMQAQTAVSSAALTLRQTSPIIYAPISGTVTGLSLQVGSVLSSGSSSSETSSTKIASIQTDAFPTVSVNLTEIDVRSVHLNDKATVTFDSILDKTFTGKVLSIDTVGSVSSGVTTYPTVIQLDLHSDEIFSNMSAQATIITDTKDDILLVPTSAITTTNGQNTVRILENGTPQQVAVETGLSSDSQTEITSGLNEGATVITGTVNTSSTKTTQSSSVFSAFGGRSGGNAVRIAR